MTFEYYKERRDRHARNHQNNKEAFWVLLFVSIISFMVLSYTASNGLWGASLFWACVFYPCGWCTIGAHGAEEAERELYNEAEEQFRKFTKQETTELLYEYIYKASKLEEKGK